MPGPSAYRRRLEDNSTDSDTDSDSEPNNAETVGSVTRTRDNPTGADDSGAGPSGSDGSNTGPVDGSGGGTSDPLGGGANAATGSTSPSSGTPSGGESPDSSSSAPTPTGGGANEATGSTSPSSGTPNTDSSDPTGGGANEATGATSPTGGTASGTPTPNGGALRRESPAAQRAELNRPEPEPQPPEQGVEELPEGKISRRRSHLAQQAAGLEQEFLGRYPYLDEQDVRVTQEGDQLKASLNEAGREEVVATRYGVDPEDVRIEGDTIIAETEAARNAFAMRRDRDRPDPTRADDRPSDPGGTSAFGTGNESISRSRESPMAADDTQATQGGDVRLAVDATEAANETQSEDLGADVVPQRAEEFLRGPATAATQSFFDTAVSRYERATAKPDSFADRALDDAVRDTADMLGRAPTSAAETAEAAAGIARDLEQQFVLPGEAVFQGTESVRAEQREGREDLRKRGERTVAAARQTAERVQANPAQAGGVAAQVGVGALVGTTASRAIRATTGVRGPDISGRVAQRTGPAAKNTASRARAAAARGASEVGDATPRVSIEADSDAPPVVIEDSVRQAPSRVADRIRQATPSTPESPSEFDVNLRQRTAVRAEVAARRAREGATGVAERARQRARDSVPTLDTDVRQSLVATAETRAADVRRRLGQPARQARQAADRIRRAPDRTRARIRETKADVGIEIAAVRARAQDLDAPSLVGQVAPSRPEVPTLDTDVRQSLAATAETRAADVRRSVEGTAYRARTAPARGRRRAREARADVALEAALARGRISEIDAATVGERLPGSPDLPELRGGDTRLRDLTVRIGESDSTTRTARVPDDAGADLGPFADDDLGDLGTDLGDSSSDRLRPSDSDRDTGQSTVTVSRARTRDRPLAETSQRRDTPQRTSDVDRLSAGASFASTLRSDAAAAPSVAADTEPSVAADDRTRLGESAAPTTAATAGLDSRREIGSRTGARTDTDVGTRLDTGLRADTDTDLRNDARRDTRTDVPAFFDSDPQRQRLGSPFDLNRGSNQGRDQDREGIADVLERDLRNPFTGR